MITIDNDNSEGDFKVYKNAWRHLWMTPCILFLSCYFQWDWVLQTVLLNILVSRTKSWFVLVYSRNSSHERPKFAEGDAWRRTWSSRVGTWRKENRNGNQESGKSRKQTSLHSPRQTTHSTEETKSQNVSGKDTVISRLTTLSHIDAVSIHTEHDS